MNRVPGGQLSLTANIAASQYGRPNLGYKIQVNTVVIYSVPNRNEFVAVLTKINNQNQQLNQFTLM